MGGGVEVDGVGVGGGIIFDYLVEEGEGVGG